MKVCLVVNNISTNNGGGRFVYDFIRSFEGSDVQFEVITFNPVQEKTNFSVTVLRPIWWRVLLNTLTIRTVAKRCDIAHSFDFFPNGIYTATALVGLRKKHVITAIGTGSVSPLYNPTLTPMVKRAASSASAIIAISKHTADLIRRKLPQLNISIILPFLDPTWGRNFPTPDAEFVKKVNGYSPYVLSVISRIKPRKGCIQNIRAFARARKELPELQYVMVATIDDTPYSRAVAEEIKRLGLSDVVHVTGTVSDSELSWLYANARAHIMLSVYDREHHDVEGFGLVYLEAARHGVWSVGTSDSGANDAIKEGESGYVLQAENNDELVEQAGKTLVQIVKSHAEPSRRASAESFSDLLTPSGSASDYYRVYQKCLQESQN